MDEHSILDESMDQSSGLSSADLSNLKNSAKWAKFIGIVGFVFTGLLVLLALVMMLFMGSALSDLDGLDIFSGGALGAVYLILALPYFFISLYLYRFGSRTGRAVRSSDMGLLSQGLEQLNKYFTLFGILLAVMIGLYALIFLLALIGGIGLF